MKGLKIFNIIFFSLICALQLAIIFLFVDTFIMFLSNNVASMLLSILIFFPYFLIFSVILFVLNIIITMTTKIRIRKLRAQNLEVTKFDKLCVRLPWLFLLFDAILFILFYLTATVTSNK